MVGGGGTVTRTPYPLYKSAERRYSRSMKNEISVPVYESLEALLAAETALAAEAAEPASDFPSWGAAMGEWA